MEGTPQLQPDRYRLPGRYKVHHVRQGRSLCGVSSDVWEQVEAYGYESEPCERCFWLLVNELEVIR